MKDTQLDQKMTDTFFEVLTSRLPVHTSIYVSRVSVHYFFEDEDKLSWVMSPQTFATYTEWTLSLPPLIKELI